MARQLVLLEASGADWRLDEHTRQIGRRGVAEARAILRRVAERERPATDVDVTRVTAKPAA